MVDNVFWRTSSESYKNLAQEFLEIAERLQKYGWTQGAFGPPQGPNCIMGARQFVQCSHGQIYDSFQQAEAFITIFMEVTETSPMNFNDDRNTTFAAVIKALVDASKLALAKAAPTQREKHELARHDCEYPPTTA